MVNSEIIPLYTLLTIIHHEIPHDIMDYHLVMTNIAMENPKNKWRFIAGKIIYKWDIFHGYVK
jgi:hypothetical protein